MNPLRQRASPLALPLLGQFVLFNGAATSTTTMATAIGVRHKHYKPAPKEVKRLPKKPRSTPPAGHGERFWVFNHIDNDLVVYSMESEIRVLLSFSFLPLLRQGMVWLWFVDC